MFYAKFILTGVISIRNPALITDQCMNLNGERDLTFWHNYANINDDDSILDNVFTTIENSFAFIGLTEHMEQSTLKFQKLINSKTDHTDVVRSLLRNKHHANKPKLPEDHTLRSLVEHRNRLDMQLYKYVKSKFELS